jgi:RNA polymerase sigma-70 factor, ECF subfamily
MTGTVGELELVAALRRGDEAAYARLVGDLYGSMVRLAMVHVGNRAVAEEVVQEAWLAVLQQLDRFEGRSSLRTWILRILSNRAKTRATRERRTVPFSTLSGQEVHWASPPRSWREAPEAVLLSSETMAQVEAAVERLPGSQRAVLVLRDVHCMSAAETCELLGLTEVNQRVLLHRARSRVRRDLERYLDEVLG